MVTILLLIKGAIEKIVEKSTLPNDHKRANIPIVKRQSPTLLVKKAEIELWFAAILVNQKLTSK
jgi:hypothetical protein